MLFERYTDMVLPYKNVNKLVLFSHHATRDPLPYLLSTKRPCEFSHSFRIANHRENVGVIAIIEPFLIHRQLDRVVPVEVKFGVKREAGGKLQIARPAQKPVVEVDVGAVVLSCWLCDKMTLSENARQHLMGRVAQSGLHIRGMLPNTI